MPKQQNRRNSHEFKTMQDDLLEDPTTRPKPPVNGGKIPEGLIAKFKQSGWADQETHFTPADLKLAKDLFYALAQPITSQNAGLVIHSQTTARCARMLAEKYNRAHIDSPDKQLNLDLIEALGLIHDAGRFSTHAWYLNDLFLHDVFNHLDVDLKYRRAVLWPEDLLSPTEKFNDIQKLLIIADMISKVKIEDASIQSAEAGVAYHETSRAQDSLRLKTKYKIEGVQISRYLDNSDIDRHQAWATTYRELFKWANDEFNADFEKIQERALRGLNTIDEQKDRKPVVVFDLGGVAFKLSDRDLYQKVAEIIFGESSDNLTSAVEAAATNPSVLADMQSGKSDELVWSRSILEAIRKNETFKARLINMSDNQEQIVDQMAAALKDLKIEHFERVISLVTELQRDGFKVYALSDTIPGHVAALREGFPAFKEIFVSPELGVSKKSHSGHLAFWCMAARLGIMPAEVIFIDDRADCIKNAEKSGATTVKWTENPTDTDQEELIQGLKLKLRS